MGICCPPQEKTNSSQNETSQIGLKNKQENTILPNQLSPKVNNPNATQTQNKVNIVYDKTFPKGTKYEKELNSDFKYFNVFWYDPNKSNDFDNFLKCFENVQFYKGYNLESSIKFFKSESISEWIVITPGSKGEELILKLQNFDCIKTFFIFCGNVNTHAQWAKKYNKIGCLTSSPEILCQKFIELNKNYIIPNFNYQSKEYQLANLNGINSENLFSHCSPEFKLMIKEKNKKSDKFAKFCMKSINYLNSKNIERDITENSQISPFNMGFQMLKELQEEEGAERGKESFQSIIAPLKNATLLSLYFSQYPYLYNILSFQEVKNILEEENWDSLSSPFDEYNSKIDDIFEEMCTKIERNESILDEKKKLKDLQIYVILFLRLNPSFPKQYYQVINLLRDIDLCLKLYLSRIYMLFNNKRHNFINELTYALNFSELRCLVFLDYINQDKKITMFNDKEQRIINDTLTIKNYIVAGDQIFHSKIKKIEKNIRANSFQYLATSQISNYVEAKNKEKGNKIYIYFYILIIKFEELKKNIDKILFLTFQSGISFLILLYMENGDNMKLYKNQMYFPLAMILVYSPEDILYYLSKKLHFYNPLDIPNLGKMFNIKIPKITFEQSVEDNYKDGCFELAETFDVNLIKNNLVVCANDEMDLATNFMKNIYYIYKEHNALDIFFNQNCLYFGWSLYPEFYPFDSILAKRILYMYCREESPSSKSFYRIINDDLRSRDPSKIYRYINFLAIINKLINEGSFKSYEGNVYRATKLDPNLIMKLIPGSKMVNTTFWSTSKDFQIAEHFMKKDSFRNSYIFCKTIKNNIDIDSEKLNPFNEKEVLFLPFTEFRVEKVSSENKYGKKVFTIELTDLGNKNFVNIENMQIENVNTFPIKEYVEKKVKEQGLNMESLMFKSLIFD